MSALATKMITLLGSFRKPIRLTQKSGVMVNKNSINSITRSQEGNNTRIQGRGFMTWVNNKND